MVREVKPHCPLPSQAQLAYLEDELAAFIHFGPNTFYNQEWGTGQEDPERFNPTQLDAREWVRVLKETGFKKLTLVVKHHDGFVLYPTAHTDYSVKASPWRGTCSLKYPKLPQSLTWIWEFIYLLGMPIVPSIMWTEKQTTMPIIWLS